MKFSVAVQTLFFAPTTHVREVPRLLEEMTLDHIFDIMFEKHFEDV